jgi:hypothetical protein
MDPDTRQKSNSILNGTTIKCVCRGKIVSLSRLKREAKELSPEELAVLVLNLVLYVLAEFAVAFLLISINDVHDLLL